MVINWTAHQPVIASTLVGARNAEQAEENAKSLDFDISKEEMETINKLLNNLNLKV